MKVFIIVALTLFMSGCANAQSTPTPIKLDVVGESLPTIKHINDMKMKGDTLLFVYESEDGDGQRLLRRAVVDIKSHTLRVSPDMGKLEDGYFVSYMPYIGYMQDNGLKRADLAARLGVSPQYISKLLSGTENLSFKSVANIEDKLGISCFAMA